MRKFTLLLITAFIVQFIYAGEISKDEAREVAKNFWYERASQVLEINYTDIKIADYYTEVENEVNYFYIFNIQSTAGYVIVPAENALYPVLGYSFRKNFNYSKLNPALEEIFKNYKKQVEIVKKNNYNPNEKLSSIWNRYLNYTPSKSSNEIQTVDALMRSEWDQGQPYNNQCPEVSGGPGGRAYVGCVAVALAQILKYFDYPATGEGSNSYNHGGWGYSVNLGTLSADFGATDYNWADMPFSLNSGHDADATAQLMYHCGVAVEMSYSAQGSGSQTVYTQYALRDYFRYNSNVDTETKNYFTETNWINMMIGQLDNNQPMIYSGRPESGAGHAWNIDGYQYDDDDQAYHFHQNWGWGGYNNGFYSLDDMYAPANPGEDPTSLMEGQQAVMDIYPEANYPVGCGQKRNIVGMNGTIQDGSGAEQYTNNQNCEIVIQPTCGSSVTFTIEDWSVEDNDVLYIYDGQDDSGELIATIYGSDYPSTTYSSSSGYMYLNFVTDGSGTDNGWIASYSSQKCATTTIYTEMQGSVSDGSGTCEYDNSTYCSYEVDPDGAEAFLLNFTEFSMASDMDYLAIKNASGSTVHTFNAANPPSGNIEVTSSKIKAVFFTNSTGVGNGWAFDYTATTDVDELSRLNPAFNVYPNPANKESKIVLNNIKEAGTIILTNVLGKELSVMDFNTGIKEIVLSDLKKNLPAGLYFITLSVDDESYTKKIVIE